MKREEEIQLVTKDLCARLPYDTIINVNDGKYRKDVKLHPHYIFDWDAERWDAKPYLRSMSSMTEEEAKEIAILYGLKDILSIKITDEYIDIAVDDGVCSTERWTIWYDEIISSIEIFDWLNRKYFDYRGLIPMGLAIEAPKGMYNN